MFQVLAPTYEVTIVGLAIIGIGTAALLVASFSGAQKAALQSSRVAPNDMHAAISGTNQLITWGLIKIQMT